MKIKMNYFWRAGLMGLVLGLTGCGTNGASVAGTVTVGDAAEIERSLPLVRTGAAMATGGVLDFALKESGARTRLANEMYAAANAVYSLSGGTFPTPGQFKASIVAFGGAGTGSEYARFSVAIAALYAAYYPKLVTGDAKTGSDLLNAIAGGIEDATRAYVTTPVAGASVANSGVSF